MILSIRYRFLSLHLRANAINLQCCSVAIVAVAILADIFCCCYCCCCSGGVTSLCCRLLVCPTKLFHLLENASIIKKLLGWFTWQTRPRPQLFSIWVSATLRVCVSVCSLKGNQKLLCEQFNLWKQKGIRTKYTHNTTTKNEKEMKWIEKIEKFYLLQVLLSYSICLPFSLSPLQIVLLLCGKVEKRQLQVAATSSGNGNGNDLLLFSQRKRNKNPCRGVCVPCRTV